MAYLDVTPMISALRDYPEEFAMKGTWLRHVLSDHRFKFDRGGNVVIDALCDCAYLSVQQEQGRQLWDAYQGWQENYWRPLTINREFAGHFGSSSLVARLWRGVTRLLNGNPGSQRSEKPVAGMVEGSAA